MIEAYQSESAIEQLVDENYKELLLQVEVEISKGGDGEKKVHPYTIISPIVKDQSIVESDSDTESDLASTEFCSAEPDKYLTFDLDEPLEKTVGKFYNKSQSTMFTNCV